MEIPLGLRIFNDPERGCCTKSSGSGRGGFLQAIEKHD